ncbi:hypothetical protein LINPERPRIM_LOCUS22654 [Linum perenne]
MPSPGRMKQSRGPATGRRGTVGDTAEDGRTTAAADLGITTHSVGGRGRSLQLRGPAAGRRGGEAGDAAEDGSTAAADLGAATESAGGRVVQADDEFTRQRRRPHSSVAV